MHDRTCKVCGSTEVTPVAIQPALVYYTCRRCFYCEKRASLSSAHADFVASQATYYENPSINPFREPEPLARERIDQKIRIVSKYLRPSSRLLEVGPGGGTFLAWAKDSGYACTACEHSPVLSADLRSRGFTVIEGEFERTTLTDQYDAVCSFHIIEHVEAPQEHIRKAFAVVRPGGYLILATPNAASWQQRLFPKLSPNFDSAHLHVLSERSLGKLSEEAGWSVVERLTPEYTSAWLRVASKLVRRIRNEDESATAGMYSNASASGRADIAIAIIAMLTAPWRSVQARLGGGNEVMIVLRKPA